MCIKGIYMSFVCAHQNSIQQKENKWQCLGLGWWVAPACALGHVLVLWMWPCVLFQEACHGFVPLQLCQESCHLDSLKRGQSLGIFCSTPVPPSVADFVKMLLQSGWGRGAGTTCRVNLWVTKAASVVSTDGELAYVNGAAQCLYQLHAGNLPTQQWKQWTHVKNGYFLKLITLFKHRGYKAVHDVANFFHGYKVIHDEV